MVPDVDEIDFASPAPSDCRELAIWRSPSTLDMDFPVAPSILLSPARSKLLPAPAIPRASAPAFTSPLEVRHPGFHEDPRTTDAVRSSAFRDQLVSRMLRSSVTGTVPEFRGTG